MPKLDGQRPQPATGTNINSGLRNTAKGLKQWKLISIAQLWSPGNSKLNGISIKDKIKPQLYYTENGINLYN
jgi:hypothetical protein